MFEAISTKHEVSRELECLAFWEERGIFAKSMAIREGAPRFVFYEGPPTLNGRPHVGHLIPRILKDVFPRYKTMCGFLVERKGGWDTQGLPVEIEVEKELGLSSKSQIESYGAARFIEKCKDSVKVYRTAWEEMIRRYGFWIDLDDPYVTMDDNYIESLWWALADAFNRGLLYAGYKVVPYCTRCGTPLSSHEVAQGYRLVKDPSVFLRFPLKDDPSAALLVWTTTPWTLPANMALAVGPHITYCKVDHNGETLILAKDLLGDIFPEGVTVLAELPGDELLGIEYVPPFEFFAGPEKTHYVLPGDFVTTTEGTGIVHVAPAFGQDDYLLCEKNNIPVFQPVDADGKFTSEADWLAGKFVKDADPEIMADLEKRKVLFRAGEYEHDYPFCWRCDSPLLYYARSSWFLRMTEFREQLLENNNTIQWHPTHIRDGRFGDWLENVVDWAVSRDRYWGTPLPIWTCSSCRHTFAVESREKLVQLAADPDEARAVELHRPYIDDLQLTCPECAAPASRVAEVVDCWFDAGCMHTAQWHYPFENKDVFTDWYPADFITEAQDQTRGWFYTLLATSTLLYGTSCYKHVICTGLGLDGDGNKMSKSRKNVVDPMETVEHVGADAVRWYMCTVTMPWNSRPFDEALIQEPIRGVLGTLRNVCAFFVTYAKLDGFDPSGADFGATGKGYLDRWVLHRLNELVGEITEYMDAFDVTHACRAIERFVADDLSNWYVRLGRARFWKSQETGDKADAYATLYHTLVTVAKLMAPIAPFFAEEIYQNLAAPIEGAPESVHLCDFPEPDEAFGAPEVDDDMDNVRRIANLTLSARNAARIKVRQPLGKLTVLCAAGESEISAEGKALIAGEVNVKALETTGSRADFVRSKVKLEHGRIGPRYGNLTKDITQAVAQLDEEALASFRATGGLNLSVEGHEVQLTAEDVRFIEEPKEGASTASDAKWFVALDTTISEGLRLEGLARDIIRQVQVARKEAGFRVEDRIHLYVSGSQRIVDAIDANAQMIAGEVLAVELERGEAPAGYTKAEVSIAGESCTMAMKVV